MPAEPVAPGASAIALHGWSCPCPAGWDAAVVRGHRQRGLVILAADRRPCLQLAWRRSPVPPDLRATLRQALAHHRARTGDAGPGCEELPHPHLLLSSVAGDRGEGPPDGDGRRGASCIAVHWLAETGVTLILRQLDADPDTSAAVRRAARAARGFTDREPWPWQVHGLSCTLPAACHLDALTHVPGLVRGVWTRRRAGGAADGVIVLRRLACAGRVLGGSDLEDWLVRQLPPTDRLQRRATRDGSALVEADAPPASWWRRWRGERTPHRLEAAWDAASDRLLILDWRGAGSPPVHLRSGSVVPA